ncbi:DUF4238 domain-containing protein [Sphingomonas sp. MMS12-HWE2-04]|uniref:DUF4238 domain-containing protein n=1 Tax=Sphingomonas sp. MMS12-HWE2-04 TaxID=3234199 RepID=UPI00384DD604
MTGNPPRRHHYIPEFYQRKWAGEDRRVERYERINGVVVRRRVFPSAAGFREDLYRHPRAEMDEWNAQALEWAVFKIIDEKGARALEALVSDPMALRDNIVRNDWAVFLRTMLLRTPYQMTGTMASLEQIWRDTEVSEKYAAMRKPGMPETATEFLEMLNPHEAKESAFRMFADGLGSDRTIRHIIKLPWRIFDCSTADHRLLLSDHPVVLVPLKTDDGHIAMPLSPTKFLVAATSDRTKAMADTLRPKSAVRVMNKLAVQRAQHCVIARDQAQDLFIRKHFGAHQIPPFLAPSKL